MQTYRFDGETKEFLCVEAAFLDPLESEAAGEAVYMLPADSTFDAPPAAKPGYAAVWNGAAWELREDHRQKRDRGGVLLEGTGTPFWMPGDTWQTPARFMKELGRLPEGAMLERPEKPAEVLAEEELARAKAERARAVAALTVELDGMVFDGDEKAQERMARAVLMAESPEESMEWVLADSSVVIVTADQLRRACRAAGKAMGALWVVPYQN
jgi:hypothetical protein